tara:strand:- start:142 stop:351 length:210 start_codon:yes stop_codon:yes gene_type:complete
MISKFIFGFIFKILQPLMLWYIAKNQGKKDQLLKQAELDNEKHKEADKISTRIVSATAAYDKLREKAGK